MNRGARLGLGITAACALFVGALAAGWWSKPALAYPELSAGDLAALPTAPGDECQAWLSAYRQRFDDAAPAQVLLVEATAAGPVVIGVGHADFAEADADTSEDNGWLVPWPALADALTARPDAPLTTGESRFGRAYEYRIVPVKHDAGVYLVASRSYEPPAWIGVRGAAMLAAAVMLFWAFSGRDE